MQRKHERFFSLLLNMQYRRARVEAAHTPSKTIAGACGELLNYHRLYRSDLALFSRSVVRALMGKEQGPS
jgi:hypothetical protein